MLTWCGGRTRRLLLLGFVCASLFGVGVARAQLLGTGTRTPNAVSVSRMHAPSRSPLNSSRQPTLRPLGVRGNWHLIFNSTFATGSLAGTVWRPGWFGDHVTGPINTNETACYNSGNVKGGGRALNLAVTRVPSRCRGHTQPYTGAVISTNPYDGRATKGFQFRYGLLESKIYLPAYGPLIADWPALLTLGQVWPKDGENDIAEGLGGTICFHFHSPGFEPGGPLGGCIPGLTSGWHTVATDWEPGTVSWYYDGLKVGHIDRGVTAAPMYVTIVNSTSVKAPKLARPDVMRVAYVRVWQHAAH